MRYTLLARIAAPLLAAMAAHADSFQDMVAAYGQVKTLAGIHQATTTNPDGSSINFWSPTFENQPASTAILSNPHMADADAYGNIYIADKASDAILKITPDGLIHTFAGTHVDGFNGDGPAPANTLNISQPNGLCVFPNGIVYLLDPGNHRIRRVGLDGQMTTVVNDTDPNWKSSGRALWVSADEKQIYYTHEYPGNPVSIGAVLKRWTPVAGIETILARSVGLTNPANLDLNPVDGKLYLCDRAEEDASRLEQGVYRIDGVNQRTRVTGDANQPIASDGQLAINSFIEQPRGIAFQADGSYFVCGHKDGNVWFVDTSGVLHKYLSGSGRKDGYSLPDGATPPLLAATYFAQPRSVTIAPNGNLLVVCNDSGFVFRVQNIAPSLATNVSLQISGQDAHVQWTSRADRGYRIESTDDLSNSLWQPITAVQGIDGVVDYLAPNSTGDSQRFYRVAPSL
jgi:sugar lactone lactonase YvrE